MLYVACGGCRNVSPLFCASGVILHGPVLAIQGPMGAQCPFCGPMLPWFVCGVCGLYQMMFFPSLPPMLAPRWIIGQVPIAPTVQAPPGIDASALTSLIRTSVRGFLEGAATEVGQDFGNALSGWIQDSFQNGFSHQI